VAGAGPVRVTVHDLLGREVAVLVDGFRPAGRHSVTFDGSRMSSGMYYYRLQTARGSQSRPLVLTR